MGDMDAKGEELERKADRKIKSWGFFSSNKYDDAAELLDKAANSYKLAKSWDKAASCYMKLADCYLKADSKHEAASAYVDAGRCFMKNKPQEAARVLNTATTLFMEAGRLSTAAKQFKDIADINEKEEKWEEALEFYEKAADLYDAEGQSSASNQCKLKVGQIAAQLEQYPKAIDIFESVARQSMDNNLLKYSVKGYLLNAGLCHLCRDDSMAIQNALEKYEDLDPTFSNTREYKFLKDLAEAADEVDVTKFTDVVKEFDSLTRLDSWKTTLLLRAKNHLKTLDEQEEDLT